MSLADIPHPTWHYLIVSIEVFCLLYIPKKILDLVFDWELKLVSKWKLSAARKLEIRVHARHHGGKLQDCAECEFLRLAPPAADRQESALSQSVASL